MPFWLALKNSCQLNVVSFYLMLVLNLFLSIVCLFGGIVMQDFLMTFLKFKNDVRLLFLTLLFKLELCCYVLSLDGYLSTIYVLQGDYVCLKISWMDVHKITWSRNSHLSNSIRYMIQGLGYLIAFLFHEQIAWSACSFIMLLNFGMSLPVIETLSVFLV